MHQPHRKVAILGASRGLGFFIAKSLTTHPFPSLWLSSRKITELQEHPDFQWPQKEQQLVLFPADFTQENALTHLIPSLQAFSPEQIIYCAGGGPYGSFHQKPWHSHLWAFRLNLLFPSQLLHTLLKEKNSSFHQLKQVVFIGSAVAENQADPGASSYAAAKHGLRGLLHSLIEENKNNPPVLDIRLYSPHYMNTDLLPKNSKPRQQSQPIDEPSAIAEDLIQWSNKSLTTDHSWHRIVKSSL